MSKPGSQAVLKRGRPVLRLWFWVMAFAPLVLMLPLAPSVAQTRMSERVVTEHRGFRDQPSVERYRIIFTDRTVRLVIPRNYLTHWYTSVMTKSTPGFMGVVTFPGFSGATRENMDCLGRHALMRCDTVQFSYTDSVRPIEPNLTWYLRDRDLLVPREYGLMGYPNQHQYLVHFDENGWVVQVGCAGVPEWERLPCEMSFSTAGARWRIQFRPALMPRWREIAEGLRVLIDSFAVAGAEAPD
ncbi:MAG: hypothetical protein ING16_04765 [Roseomonas sp.]|nr:hypothetical protein [Roseomonas sp.]